MPVPVDPSPLGSALAAIVGPDRALTREIDRVAFASDASFYRLMPQAVVLTRHVGEIRALFRLSRDRRVPLTFRAAGTSLSGQAITDGVLVEVARHWRAVRVEDEGRRVRVQPGAIGAVVNQCLRPFATKIGPDPASIGTCTMGGILANNSSGMCCGVANNAYHTLDSLTFVLPSGTTLDTAGPDADARLRAAEPALWQGLLDLRDRLRANPVLSGRIRAKYRMKNTNGYSLNALLDFDRPIDILAHLLIGSEGTLGFIAEAVLRTVPDLPVRYTGLLLYPSMHAACAAIVPWREAGAAALEVMDRAALRSVERQAGAPPELLGLPPGTTGLLVELQAAEESARPDLERLAADTCGAMTLVTAPRFTHDQAAQAALWQVRKGMFPSVGAVRRSGTTVIIEDVAFPVDTLADAAVDLIDLFGTHNYPEAIIFGHARDGNLHFVITQSFNAQADVDQYARFIDAVVRLVVERYDGALKGEHGTGRNMAPFVEAEWGPEAVDLMRRLKALCDPDGLLNPGVILNDDPRAHLTHLKPLPPVETEVDTCIECGYCEPLCPSREFTLTPRQRIVVRREMTRLASSGEHPGRLRALQADFPHMALDTCAVDGLCATACPVGIDTGQLVKRLRQAAHSPATQWLARAVAERFQDAEAGVRMALRAGHLAQRLLGEQAVCALTRWTQRLVPTLPLWSRHLPRAARDAWLATDIRGATAIYFPSCITRTMGAIDGEPDDLSLADALVTVAARAGRPVHVPHDLPGTCCGVPFSSKGLDAAYRVAINHAIDRFATWSEDGRLPIVIDTSPCAYGLRSCRPWLTGENQVRYDRLRLLDVVEFLTSLLPHLHVRRLSRQTALHPVCSAIKLGLATHLQTLAEACCEAAVTPPSAGCCAMAGDRGLLLPELAAAATREEAREVQAGGFRHGYSTSRTCEVNLTRATGIPYRSVVFLVEEATREASTAPPEGRRPPR